MAASCEDEQLERKILQYLKGKDKVATKELSKKLNYHKRDISRVLYQLQKRDIVEKIQETPPEWRITLKPTEKNHKKNSALCEVKLEDIEVDRLKKKRCIGKIAYCKIDKLAKGSQGTTVYRGTFEKRDVAVKRILSDHSNLIKREESSLILTDQHRNIVRLYGTESDSHFHYVALELCSATLQEYVEDQTFNRRNLDPKTLLFQVSLGLEHLHVHHKIVHRDIKPSNVLISVPNIQGELKAMISDFGLSKRLDASTNPSSSGAPGSSGWIAPELLEGAKTRDPAGDIFSFGCVFYYVLTDGKHPFGEPLRQQSNILDGITKLINDDDNHCLENNLVQLMIKKDPKKRITIQKVIRHPFLWSNDKKLCFIQTVSDYIQGDKTCEVIKLLEANRLSIAGGDWTLRLCTLMQEEVATKGPHRKYSGNSVSDLLRLIRNLMHHLPQKPVVKALLGSIPKEEFLSYFTSRYPRLLLDTYSFTQQCIKDEEVFMDFLDIVPSLSQLSLN